MKTNETNGATARPWQVHNNIGRKGELGILANAAPCIIATMGNAKAWPDFAQANAALIVQAVNERDALLADNRAMRATLERIVDRAKYYAGGEAIFTLESVGSEARQTLARLNTISVDNKESTE